MYEGAIKIMDGKARLEADSLCDGLGACLGECPQGAITIEEREIAWPDPISIFERLWTARGAPKIGSSPAELALLDPGLARLIRRSASISLADHLQALHLVQLFGIFALLGGAIRCPL